MKVTGVTVHFVDEGMDTGPVICQEPVRVEDDDTAESLAARIHALEHELLPRAIRADRGGEGDRRPATRVADGCGSRRE